ncbi:MAG: hypothetical protein HC842_00150 [Cytophagales bacterium]|nr:hypothetical protein [Cytophagales bacterium]
MLGYVLNEGYAQEVMDWHRQHPEVEVHCFWDKREADEVYEPWPGLSFHRLNDKKFADMMERCRAYVSTAGFESICEALYLDKPVMMIPVAGHYEQACNALDAKLVNAGIAADSFDLSLLMDYIPRHQSKAPEFRAWVAQGPDIFRRELSL